VKEEALRHDKVPRNTRHEAAAALVAQSAEQADELAVTRAERGDVVKLVVLVGAREALAPGDGSVAVLGEDLLDAVVVAGVHNGGDVKVSRASEAVEAHFSKHARDVGGTVRD